MYIRDRGRCVFVGEDDRKCGARGFVEFHHLVTYATGGKPTVENIELRCRAHNGYEADMFFRPAQAWPGAAIVREATALGCVMNDAFRSGTRATDDGGPARVESG